SREPLPKTREALLEHRAPLRLHLALGQKAFERAHGQLEPTGALGRRVDVEEEVRVTGERVGTLELGHGELVIARVEGARAGLEMRPRLLHRRAVLGGRERSRSKYKEEGGDERCTPKHEAHRTTSAPPPSAPPSLTLRLGGRPVSRYARRMIRSKILGLGSYVPDRVVKNEEIPFLNDKHVRQDTQQTETNDEWIRARTGIEERRYVPNDGKWTTSDLGVEAAKRAIEDAG